LLADYVILLVIGKIFPEIDTGMLHQPAVSALVTIICKIVLLIMILFIKRRIGRKSGEMLNDPEWLRMLLIPLITIISLTAIMVKYNVLENINQDHVLLYIALGMAVMNINVFYLINDILEREAVINKDRLFREKIKNETNRYYSMSENLEEQRKKAHEFKNHMAYIFALANKEQYQELKEYIMKIDNDLKVSMDMIDTNNAIVNAVLNAKYREAVDRGIVFILKVNDLFQIRLPDVDIVVMLSNLLNNAIEACEVSEEKVIKLKLILEDGQILLSVKNSMSKSPVKRNGVFLSQKEDAKNHGMGVANIVDVVERHGGRHVIDYDDSSFSFTILLDNK
uniref:sensor histidine kinase n=1 Tax=Agathobacter sp. TaxID=2021311 RepID=UPI004057C1F7